MGATLLQSLFRQKAAINEEFFAVIDRVDAEAHPAERHALIRLMNHIYVVDRIFAAHLRGEPHGYEATNTPETPALDALRDAVLASDRGYLELVDALTPPQLAQMVAFTFTDGQRGRMTREEMLGHVITHGLSLAGRRAHRVADALAASLKGIGGAIANVSSRVGQAFADLGGQPRREPDRQARANARARDDPEQKARASGGVSLFVLTLW